MLSCVDVRVWSTCDTLVITQDLKEQGGQDAEILLALHALSSYIKHRSTPPKIIVELLEHRYSQLVRLYGDVTVLMSTKLASDVLVQLADAPYRSEIFSELLDPDGNELYLRELSHYLRENESSISFTQLCARARSRGETAIGWVDPKLPHPSLSPLDPSVKLSTESAVRVVVIARD